MVTASFINLANLPALPRAGVAFVEAWLEHERDQLALWLPVALGTGIGLWFALPSAAGWSGVIAGGVALALGGVALGHRRRVARVLIFGGILIAMGCALAWWRATSIAAPRLARTEIVRFAAQVERIDLYPAKGNSRLLLRPIRAPALPPRLRVTVDDDKMLAGLAVGERVVIRARLLPPPTAAVPGGYDFSRAAWFQGIGGVGKALEKVARVGPASTSGDTLRARLSARIRSKIEGSAGGIASAFATGDRGGIDPADEEAMRASGLTHLLSISGLHITAVVAATMFFTLRLLALSPLLALRLRLTLVAAVAGAAAGIGYTLLTGAEVPTIRSCIAAVLVICGIALGREAITLRLVAAGALIVLLLWPEALVGPSFQLSFGSIVAIVALHEHPKVRALTMRRDESWHHKIGREVLSLVITGLAVEIVLAPIALYHFHKSGLYGAFANIIAIPLTTFVVMPLEALAILLDTIGLGVPLWWLTEQSLNFLLWIARTVAVLPGAVATLPSVPVGAFVLFLCGGLWLLLWKARARFYGLALLLTGGVWAWQTPPPDLLITGDGMHMAVRDEAGQMAMLRPRAGDFVRGLLAEISGTLDPLMDMEAAKEAECGRDMCTITLLRGGRTWRIAATRSAYRLPWVPFTTACAAADIMVSDRRLPKGCTPRWIKADRAMLARTGGLSVSLGTTPSVSTQYQPGDQHPWALQPKPTYSARRKPFRAGNTRRYQ